MICIFLWNFSLDDDLPLSLNLFSFLQVLIFLSLFYCYGNSMGENGVELCFLMHHTSFLRSLSTLPLPLPTSTWHYIPHGNLLSLECVMVAQRKYFFFFVLVCFFFSSSLLFCDTIYLHMLFFSFSFSFFFFSFVYKHHLYCLGNHAAFLSITCHCLLSLSLYLLHELWFQYSS